MIEKLPDSNAIKSEGPPDKPEDWPRLFEGHLNAGALEAVIALYEPDATIIAPSGETLVGRERIRSLLASMIEAKTCLHGRVVKAVSSDGIALLLTDFDGTTGDGSGKTGAIRHKAIEVLRRQPNGSWKLILGDPRGRDELGDAAPNTESSVAGAHLLARFARNTT